MKTFIIIKPDAIERGLVGRIISRFEDAGFVIDRIEMQSKSHEWFNRMYRCLTGDAFIWMDKFMTNTPLIGIILKGHDAINRVRMMVGPTDSTIAAPGTIRGDFGRYPIRYNCVHSSDCERAFLREAILFFGDNDER